MKDKATVQLSLITLPMFRITTMMAIIVGAFTLCWTPFAVMFILFPTDEEAANWFVENAAVIEWITWIGLCYKIYLNWQLSHQL